MTEKKSSSTKKTSKAKQNKGTAKETCIEWKKINRSKYTHARRQKKHFLKCCILIFVIDNRILKERHKIKCVQKKSANAFKLLFCAPFPTCT